MRCTRSAPSYHKRHYSTRVPTQSGHVTGKHPSAPVRASGASVSAIVLLFASAALGAVPSAYIVVCDPGGHGGGGGAASARVRRTVGVRRGAPPRGVRVARSQVPRDAVSGG